MTRLLVHDLSKALAIVMLCWCLFLPFYRVACGPVLKPRVCFISSFCCICWSLDWVSSCARLSAKRDSHTLSKWIYPAVTNKSAKLCKLESIHFVPPQHVGSARAKFAIPITSNCHLRFTSASRHTLAKKYIMFWPSSDIIWQPSTLPAATG